MTTTDINSTYYAILLPHYTTNYFSRHSHHLTYYLYLGQSCDTDSIYYIYPNTPRVTFQSIERSVTIRVMVRLNKNELSSKQLKSLLDQFDTTISQLNVTETNLILDELLGHEERIMLAKRLATIILLLEGTSLYKTSVLLHISPATAQKVQDGIRAQEYDHIITLLGKNKRDYFAILDTLDAILHLGGILPHYNGLDRYRI